MAAVGLEVMIVAAVGFVQSIEELVCASPVSFKGHILGVPVAAIEC